MKPEWCHDTGTYKKEKLGNYHNLKIRRKKAIKWCLDNKKAEEKEFKI